MKLTKEDIEQYAREDEKKLLEDNSLKDKYQKRFAFATKKKLWVAYDSLYGVLSSTSVENNEFGMPEEDAEQFLKEIQKTIDTLHNAISSLELHIQNKGYFFREKF